MNKLFKKIATLSVGLAMAIGVGVAVASKGNLQIVKAATATMTSFSATSGNVGSDTNVTYAAHRGGGTSNPQINSSAIRLYQNANNKTGGMIVIKTSSGYIISSITIQSTLGTTVGVVAGTEYTGTTSIDKTAVDSSKSVSANTDVTFNNFSDNVVTMFCLGTASSSRWYVSKLSVTYKSDDKKLSSIAVTTPPTKTSYYVGDSFDSTNMVVTATYSDNTKADVTSSCTFDPATFTSTGNQNVTVSYTEGGVTRTTTQEVAVSANTLQSISISDYNTTLAKDGPFTFGGTVTATYASGKESDVTASATFEGYDMSTAGEQTVTVSYTEGGITQTANYTLNVVRLNVVTFTPGTDVGGTSVTKSGVTAAMSKMDNNSYYQIYASESGTFTSEVNILKIEFTCTDPGTDKYGPGNTSANVGNYSYSNYDGTWTGSAKSVTLSSTKQVRMTSLTITTEAIAISATINGDDSVNSGTQWASQGIVDDNQQTVTGATYQFVAGQNTTIETYSTANGTFTATTNSTQGGTVTVKATATGYIIADKTVTINSLEPYINPNKTSTSGYTGCSETIGFTYGNLTGALGVTTSNANVSASIVNDTGSSANVVITFVTATANSSSVYLNDGQTTRATITVTKIDASSVSITGLASTANVYTTKTLDLGSTITVTATGSYSKNVTWSSDNAGVASVDPDTGVVTGVAEGTANITVTSDDYPSATMTCAVTVAELPLAYVINFGSYKNTNPTEIKTDTAFKSTWENDIDDVTVGDFSKIYGETSSQLKGGSGSATASISFTIPSTSYITSVVIVVETAGGTSMNVVSGASGAQTENQTIAVGTLTFDDYLASEKSNKVLITSTATGAFYLSSITINYANFEASLTASPSSFDVTVKQAQDVTLTPSYFTPTDYTAVVKSGSSLTAEAVEFTGNIATITAGSVTGLTVFTITGTGGGKNASVDVSVNVTQDRNLINLVITTASDNTTFKVGESFDVGSLVITATFDADPTTVVYSKANKNMGVLTSTPSIGYAFQESDIGNNKTATFALKVGTGDLSVSYSYNVIDKTYAAKITSVQDLWDGQQIYFGDKGGTKVNIAHSGGNQLGSQAAVVHETKGLSVDELARDGAYTVHREKIDSTIYYSFYKDGYYLEASNVSNNYLTRTDTLSDNCRYTISIDNTGAVTMTNKGNKNRPEFRWNSGSDWFSQYQSSSTLDKAVIYAITSYSEQAVADAFVERYLHMSEEVEGQCNTYYPILKPVWAAMGDLEKAALSGAAYERLQAWAAARGEHLNSNMDLVSNTRINLIYQATKNSGLAIIVIALSVLSIAAIGGYFFLRKKKED